jgi:prepilin-type N-terminal cleavage/methylation domain-containing protein
MTTHQAHRPVAGFTLAELLVALAALGILLTMLVQVTGQVASNTQALGGRMENISEATRLRRLLHRDLNSALPGSFQITNNGFTITTSHNLLIGQPLPVVAGWDFSGGAVRRIERLEAQGYTKELLLTPDLEAWKAEVFSRHSNTWVDIRNFISGLGSNRAAGLRLTLTLPGGTEELVELLPEAE